MNEIHFAMAHALTLRIAALPLAASNTLNVREMKFAVRERGFRTRPITVVSTLRDETKRLVELRLTHLASHRVGHRPIASNPAHTPNFSPIARDNFRDDNRQCHSFLTPFRFRTTPFSDSLSVAF